MHLAWYNQYSATPNQYAARNILYIGDLMANNYQQGYYTVCGKSMHTSMQAKAST
jgi:hypothetical protein